MIKHWLRTFYRAYARHQTNRSAKVAQTPKLPPIAKIVAATGRDQERL